MKRVLLAMVMLAATAAYASSNEPNPCGNSGNNCNVGGSGGQGGNGGIGGQGGSGGQGGIGGQGGSGGQGGTGGIGYGGSANASAGAVAGAAAINKNDIKNTNQQAQGQQQGQAQDQSQSIKNSGNSSSSSGVKNSGNSLSESSVKNSGNSSSNSSSNSGGNKLTNEGNNASTSVSVGGDIYEAARIPVATAYAAPLTSSNGTCMGSTSAGLQVMSFGLSGGSTWTDSGCDARYDAQALREAGLPKVAIARLCLKPEIAKAMTDAGQSCVAAKPNASVATAPVFDKRPTASNETYSDPIIRARLGLPPLSSK
jgi:hypothetical protein